MNRYVRLSVCASLLLAAVAPTAGADPVPVGDFEDLSDWKVTASDGVEARIAPADGVDGRCLRLDFNFRAGAGFCVVRREISLELPANYRFSFAVRGEALANNFEFKLIDPSGDNVWWVNRRAFEFPGEWQTVRYRARHFRFAWGPSGGARMERIGAVEFAVAASSGGAGTVFIDSLTFEPLPEPEPVTHAPIVHCSSAAAQSAGCDAELPADGALNWRSADGDAAPWLELDLQQDRELGGVVIDWAPDAHPADYTISLSSDGAAWETAAQVRHSNGGRDHVALPEAEARRMRIAATSAPTGRPIGITRLAIREVEFAESPNRFFAAVAADWPRGRYPAYLLGRQTPWTVVGVADDDKEALVSAHGAVEVDRGGWTVEPFLHVEGRLLTWADVEISQSLAEGYLPVPHVDWRSGDWRLFASCFADGASGASELVAAYEVCNLADETRSGTLYLAIRPFQVLPPWQELNLTGGVARISAIERTPEGVRVGDRLLVPWTAPTAFGATTFAQGDISEYLANQRLPDAESATDPDGFASAALSFDFELGPGESRMFVVSAPLHGAGSSIPEFATGHELEAYLGQRRNAMQDGWRRALNRVRLELPESGRQIADTFRATQAHILINGDGPSIQPGSRTYERSWIRDGAVTSAALLATGHTDKVRRYLAWYAKYQYPDGKVPCVVDRRGPDPVPEHDSSGELLYALCNYHRFTGDTALLEAHLPNVVSAVDYLEGLRNQRTTERYAEGTPIERACFGLVPESISHEGYSAKPMHSYWDNFFTIKGFADAAAIARVLHRSDLAQRFDALHQAHRDATLRSLKLAMAHHGIDYLPGCVELGDFDATSTAIGIFPCDLRDALPQEQLARTFERYFDNCTRRAGGAEAWDNYTPYELRCVGALVRLGEPERAHALLKFFLADQSPPGWRQWAEVVWRDPEAPRFIGDMPHTWVGSAFMNSLRTMFLYEEADALVLLAGAKQEWLAGEGVRLTGFPTWFGVLDLGARLTDGKLTVDIGGAAQPPAGFRVRLPRRDGVRAVRVDGQNVEIPAGGEVRIAPTARQVVVEWAGS